jgi:hypothetical protein
MKTSMATIAIKLAPSEKSITLKFVMVSFGQTFNPLVTRQKILFDRDEIHSVYSLYCPESAHQVSIF